MADPAPQDKPTARTRQRWAIGLAIAAGLTGLAAANAHLVYAAITSQPDCVPHSKQAGSGEASTTYRAARSSC